MSFTLSANLKIINKSGQIQQFLKTIFQPIQSHLNLNLIRHSKILYQNLNKLMIILYNEQNLLHKLTSKYHPQRPQRITQVISYMKQTKYSKFIYGYLKLKERIKIDHEEISQIALQQIVKVHGQRYFDFVEGMWCQGISKPQMFINVDTYYMKQTFNAAFEAVKTILLAVQYGLQESSQDFICLIRPPGHHSGMKNQPHGFSFFNNVAVAANYFVSKTKKNVVIIDWDIHHGEGTQNIFYNRNDVLYISLHRYDNCLFFPHVKQSRSSCLGQKQGAGFNINIAWNFPGKKSEKREATQTVRDEQYIYCFQSIIEPILKQYDFEAVFVSCGFDCGSGDPIGQSQITEKGFRYMTNVLKSFKKPVFVALEGGYNLDTIKTGVQSVAEGLSQDCEARKVSSVKFQDLNDFARQDISIAMEGIKKYWKI